MPVLRTSIDEPTEHVSIETELAAEWKFQTGPLAPTELLHADLDQSLGVLTLSATGGAPPVIADLSKTLGTLTLSAAGTVVSPPITANLSKTLGALTVSASGTTTIAADLGKTLGPLTLSATATAVSALLIEDGSFLLTEGNDHILLE